MKIAIIGLGEAGTIYASDIAAHGDEVWAYSPHAPTTPPGVTRAGSLAEAVTNAAIVIVLTTAEASPRIATEALPHLRSGALYADFTTASADTLAEEERAIEAAGARFADVAILGAVPFARARTAVIISGSAASQVGDYLAALGADVELVDGCAGEATARKLLRSVLMKSLASVVVEAITAGRAAGCEPWVREQIAGQLSGDVEAKIERYETGTKKHAVRRSHEMEAVVDYLTALGVPSEMSDASKRTLERLAKQNPPATIKI